MDIRLARNMLKSAINNKKAEYEAMLKLDQALAYYDGLENRIKQMDSEDKALAISISGKKLDLSALDYKLDKKTKETEAKLSKVENDGAAKLDEAHKRHGAAEREIVSDFKKKETECEEKLSELDASIQVEGALLAKIEKAIDKHKKDFGNLVNA